MSSLTPPYLLAGGPDVTVTLGGSGFVPGSTVLLGSRPLVTTYISSTQMTFVVPGSLRSLSGSFQLTLSTPNDSAAAYLYLDIMPVLSGVTPNSAPAGSPTTPVTITGIGFAPGFGLEFITASSTSSVDFSVLNSSTITAFINASLLATPGAAKIQVFGTNSSATALPFTITAATPGKATLNSLQPASLAAGGPSIYIQVNGSGFASGCTAQWNGTALSTSVINASQLSVQIPAALTALPGLGSITVINPGGAVSNALTFTVTAQKANVRSLSPSSAVAGGPAFTLTVNGFPNSYLSDGAIFPGAVAHWNETPLATTYVNSYQLTAQVPAALIATAGPANVTIVNPGGSAGIGVVFTIVPASTPAVASLSPTSATVGSSALTLTISGSNFVPGATVSWNGASLATTFISSTQLTAQIPANLLAVAGTAAIIVFESGVPASNALNFIVSPPSVAALAAVSPTSVLAGSAGFTLTATGNGFVTGSVLQWNGGPVATSFVSSTQITAQIPSGLVAAAGTATVRVVNPSAAPSNSLTFTIAAPSPTITSLSPSSAAAGSPAFYLTVTGSGFVPGATVRWNGSALATTFVSTTQLTAQVPAASIGAADSASVSVLNPGSTPSNALAFAVTVAPVPTIANIAPAATSAGGSGFTLTVTGANFVPGSIVLWNGAGLPTTFLGSTQLTAQVAASRIAMPGSVSVTVSNAAGAADAAAIVFTIVTSAAPSVVSVSPAGVVAGSPAFTLTINGSGFVSGATVQWNGSPRTTAFVNSTQLSVQIPASDVTAPGTASITVLNPGSPASNAFSFSISAASRNRPVVQSVLNAASYTHALAPGTWAAIFGTQLATSTASAPTIPLPVTLAEVRSVTVGSVQAPLSFVSPGQINFVVPFEAAVGTAVPVVVTTSDGASVPVNITVSRNAPALFTLNAQGTGMAVALNASFQPVTSLGSDVIILYGVGLGPTNPSPVSSAQGGASLEPLNRVVDPVEVFIGEMPCQVLYAGLAPGFPGIYQLNVIPPAAPRSNRLYITENGVTSNVTTLPIPGGASVTNVRGSIDGLYPASGTYALAAGNKSTSGPVSSSEMLNAGAVSVSFDIQPDAQPFTVVAVGPGATAVVEIDPAGGTWQGSVTSPTAVARVGDFSQSGIVVYDLLAGAPFPASIIPLSRLDPMQVQAANMLPAPNVFPTTLSPNATFTYARRPLKRNGHFSIGGGQEYDDLRSLFFGAFVDIGQQPPSTQTAEFLLFVDGVLVASGHVAYPVQSRQ